MNRAGQPAMAIGPMGAATIAGLAVGFVYALSPLTVLFVMAMVVMLHWAVQGIERDERKWLLVLLIGAVVVRVAAVALLFASTNHAQVPFGSFFGDEEYFIKRAIWLRNVGTGLPVHGADLIYAFDEYSATSYLYVIAFVQFLVGTAPYGVHLLGIACHLFGAILLYRVARSSFGRMPSFIGLAIVLLMPTLFAWSISALKDPLFFALSAVTLSGAVNLVRARLWRHRLMAAGAIALLCVVLATVRQGGGVLVIASIALGFVVAALVIRPRLLLASLVVLPIVIGTIMSRPQIQLRAYNVVQAAAGQHWGHVATPGWVYKLLDDRLYPDRGEILDLRAGEALRFLVRAVTGYVTVPLPWEAQSTPALAYLPEQLFWYVLVALFVPGVLCAFRRDALVAALLFGYAMVAALMVAMTSGNVGTLIRHRGLALPYIVWLSAVGACELATAARDKASAAAPALPARTLS
jgi:hypothetical protein